VALYDRGRAAGPLQHLVARRARERTERWVAAMIEAVRDDRLREAAGSPLETVAWHPRPRRHGAAGAASRRSSC
jgi:hypothetical protein